MEIFLLSNAMPSLDLHWILMQLCGVIEDTASMKRFFFQICALAFSSPKVWQFSQKFIIIRLSSDLIIIIIIIRRRRRRRRKTSIKRSLPLPEQPQRRSTKQLKRKNTLRYDKKRYDNKYNTIQMQPIPRGGGSKAQPKASLAAGTPLYTVNAVTNAPVSINAHPLVLGNSQCIQQ